VNLGQEVLVYSASYGLFPGNGLFCWMTYELSKPFCPDGTPCKSIIYPRFQTCSAMLIRDLLSSLSLHEYRTHHRQPYISTPHHSPLEVFESAGHKGFIRSERDDRPDYKGEIQSEIVDGKVDQSSAVGSEKKCHSHPIGIRTVLRPRRLMSSKSFLTIQLRSCLCDDCCKP
jgi:hypothetical protein